MLANLRPIFPTFLRALLHCMWGSILRCSKTTSSTALLICGLLLAIANLWFTAARSLIPLAVDARLVAKERRPEKHAGIDDVYLLTLAGGRMIQVDETIYEFAAEGSELRKASWSNQLHAGTETIRLQFSRDFFRMLWVMPATIAATVVLCGLTRSKGVNKTSNADRPIGEVESSSSISRVD